MSLLSNSNAIESGGYPISNSLRFQSASSQYLSRTPAGVGTSNKIMTFSAWVKRGTLTSLQGLFVSNVDGVQFWNDNIDVFFNNGVGGTRITTSAVYRDPSSWYHIVVAVDTTQATAANRVRIYVNGSQVTSTTGTPPAQNYAFNWNQNIAQYLGKDASTNYFDGYQAEINVIDGQALTPSSFGETNTLTGQWVAKKYTGTYGTNGFYLPFSNGTSTTTLGYDSSGNSNNWTLTNFTRSAGVSDCWMNDVPSGNGGVSGTQPNSNYCVWSAIDRLGTTTSGANLNAVYNASGYAIRGTIAYPTTGKWYYEMTQSGTGDNFIGLSPLSATLSNLSNASTGLYAYYSGAFKYTNGVATSYGATFGNNDVIGVAVDCDAGTVTFYKNNTSQGTAFTGLDFSVGWQPMARVSGSGVTAQANFGQRSFAYTPPSGFKALCTANLPASTIVKGNQYMDATTYTGVDGVAGTVVNAGGFQPDLVWIKARAVARDNRLTDAVRGTGFNLSSNSTAAEVSSSIYVTAFNSNGFSYGTASDVSQGSMVAWQWDAGSSTVTNTNGTISSQVRANPTAGFSVVTWTGTGANATIGHGLGIAPSMIIVKYRNSTGNWQTYHSALGNTKFVQLNTTIAATVESTMWNNTSPTSSVFTTGTNFGSLNMVAYCFAEIAGYSKFGSYTGNGSADGTFVYCGFRPKYVLVKRTDTSGYSWIVLDSARSPYNVASARLIPNTSDAEASGTHLEDFLSNGFKFRGTSLETNASGGTYIYMAFAESPFQNSNSR